MKKIIAFCGAALTALFFSQAGYAAAGGNISVDTILPVSGSVSTTTSLRTDDLNWGSAVVLVTSNTSTAQTFNDGQAATATFTVGSYAALSSATASGSITVNSNTGIAGACISGGGSGGQFNVCNPGQWAVGAVSSNTAYNIATAIQATGVILSTQNGTGSVIYTSAPVYGTSYNTFSLASSTQSALTVATLVSSSIVTGVGIGVLTGGQDNAILTINGTKLVANTDFYPKTSNAVTATALAAAITASGSAGFSASAGQVQTTIVFATSTIVGTGPNSYVLTSSTEAALTIATLVSSSPITNIGTGVPSGGQNAGYVYQGNVVTIPTVNYQLGEGVYITTGSGVALTYSTSTLAQTITTLAWGTTIYVVPLTATTLELATTQANALAGKYMTFTSSAVKTSPDTFTLNVPAIAGTPVISWSASNDGISWAPLTVTPFNITLPSLGYGTYYATGTLTNYDFGHMDYGWLGLNVTAPTAGALNITAHVIGKQ